MSLPVITFLSDYGYEDPFVGICHGVIERRCPGARVIDLAHEIERHDIRTGALWLRDAIEFLPDGVHLAVIDPDVGGKRRAVALRAGSSHIFVGPDNGLFALVGERLGGVTEAYEIGHSPWRLEPVSQTFHGRDIFAPVAAAIAAGEPLAGAGEPLDTSELIGLKLPQARLEGGELVTHALLDDRFGNVLLDTTHELLRDSGLTLGDAVEISTGDRRVPARFVSTFADAPPGTLLLYEDANRALALALNRGSAAMALDLARDDELRIRAT